MNVFEVCIESVINLLPLILSSQSNVQSMNSYFDAVLKFKSKLKKPFLHSLSMIHDLIMVNLVGLLKNYLDSAELEIRLQFDNSKDDVPFTKNVYRYVAMLLQKDE